MERTLLKNNRRNNTYHSPGGTNGKIWEKGAETVRETMEKLKMGELKSGKSGRTVKSRKTGDRDRTFRSPGKGRESAAVS